MTGLGDIDQPLVLQFAKRGFRMIGFDSEAPFLREKGSPHPTLPKGSSNQHDFIFGFDDLAAPAANK